MPSWYTPPRYHAFTGLEVISKVARMHGFTAADLIGPSRARSLCLVRWRAMKELHNRGRSHSMIGRLFNRDHSSVINGLRRLG